MERSTRGRECIPIQRWQLQDVGCQSLGGGGGGVLRSRSLAPYSVAWETRGWRQPVIPKEISFEELSGSSKHHKQRLLCCAPSVLEDKN